MNKDVLHYFSACSYILKFLFTEVLYAFSTHSANFDMPIRAVFILTIINSCHCSKDDVKLLYYFMPIRCLSLAFA